MPSPKSTKRPSYPKSIKRGNVCVKVYRVKHPRVKAGVVYSVAWYDETGSRRQKQYTDPAEADKEAVIKADKLAAGELRAADATMADLRELERARQLAHPEPVLAALDEWRQAREACQGPILPAAKAWAERNRPSFKVKTVKEVSELFMAAKKAAGIKTSESYERTLPAFLEAVGGQQMHTVGARRLQKYLERYGNPVSRNTHRKRIVTLWRWARRAGYLPRDVQTEAELTDRAQETATDIGIIEPDTFFALLRLIEAKHKHYIAPLALAGFCGLRRIEIHGQRWEDIHLERGFVRVTTAKARTPAKRLVPLVGEAGAWLSKVAQPAGEVSPGNTWVLDRIRDIGRTAGFTLPENCFRHSFISARVAATGNLERTSLEAGNSPRIIHQHYRELMTADEGRAWFGIKETEESSKEGAL